MTGADDAAIFERIVKDFFASQRALGAVTGGEKVRPSEKVSTDVNCLISMASSVS